MRVRGAFRGQGSIDKYGDPRVSEIRMRERMNMKSKMLGALALLTLVGTLFVMQSAQQHAPTADAAAGSIAALNVGTCLTTDGKVFKGDCERLVQSGTDGWEIRDKNVEVSTLYATYAHDPKTASNEPRAILMDSDLLKISITDTARDRRDGVLIRGASLPGASSLDDIDGDDTADTNIFDSDGDDTADAGLDELIVADLGDLDYPKDSDGNIMLSSHEGADDGIWLYQGTTTAGDPNTTSEVPSSGTFTLNFTRDGDIPGAAADTAPWQFNPADFDVDSGAEVRFYGCLSATAGCTAGTDEIERLDELTVDEDASNGKAFGNTAPWLGVNASVPTGSRVVILAIYYRTSNVEDLVGGETYRECSGTGTPSKANEMWDCPDPQDVEENKGEYDVEFTKDEKDDNDALLVRATADGSLEERSVNLHLRETGRFDGVYQGYLRLTDDNGDGKDANSDPVKDETLNWGHKVAHGMGTKGDGANDDTRREEAAVLAVESGPVTIEYQDTDGRKRTLRIEIDNQVPTINVASPSHGSASGDQTPDFAGTMEDTESGLVDGSFRLVVDNRVDSNGDEGKNNDYALTGNGHPDAGAPTGSGVILRTANPPLVQATGIEDYAGYDATNTSRFGEVGAKALYNLGDDACDDGQRVCHILSESYDDGATRGTFNDSLRLDLWQTEDEALVLRDKEFEIDFQAFVMDMAGNIGFSDSDPSNPRFINDLGEKKADRQAPLPNVLGYYSAHIITLDEKDPEVITDQTATGYYGMSDKKLVADRSGIVVVFDAPVAASSVSTNTFTVELDDESMASVTEVDVDDKYVFLKLASELASDATPKIDIAQGEKVEDMAGNETFGRELTAFDANDGISPRLTVTLSGGTGTGTGDEGPERLTKDRITINISSDEDLQGSPEVAVVCSSLEWKDGDAKRDIDDYVANRNTASNTKPGDSVTPTTATNKNVAYDYTCGYTKKSGTTDLVQEYDPDDGSRALARPGDNWEHTWQNPTGEMQKLLAGKITVVAFASDRSRFQMGEDSNVRNWGSASAEFAFDNVPPENAELQPADGGTSKEVRPFVLIKFDDMHSVTLDSVELDDVEIASEFTQPEPNQFVYWPLSLIRGEHEVAVEASDAAGNESTFEYSFTVEERGDFLLNLLAGWNAVSVPADPVDTAIGAVFTNPAIDTVIGWDTDGWRIAVRRDGVWESNHQYGTLNEIRSRYGYWVKSNNFVRQPIALTANDRGVGGPRQPVAIPTLPGWNFVGVIDQDGDQTEGDSGNSLMAGKTPVTASEYLGSTFVRAYTWDATFNRFEVLSKDEAMTIGEGVWVYYQGGIAP